MFNAKITEPFLHIRARYHSPTPARSSSFKKCSSGSSSHTPTKKGSSHSSQKSDASPRLPSRRKKPINSSSESVASTDPKLVNNNTISQSFVVKDLPPKVKDSSSDKLGSESADAADCSSQGLEGSSDILSSSSTVGASNEALADTSETLEDTLTRTVDLGTSDTSIPELEYNDRTSSSIDPMVSSCPSLSFLVSAIDTMTTQTVNIGENITSNLCDDSSQPSSSTKEETVVFNEDSLAYLGNSPFDQSREEIDNL